VRTPQYAELRLVEIGKVSAAVERYQPGKVYSSDSQS